MQHQYQLQETLTAIAQLNFTGNIIPHTWFKHVIFDNGKPDLLGMMILAEIVYWYRPEILRNENTGEVIGYKKKFKADMLQRSIISFATQFGCSKRQVADALKRLEQKRLIIREFRTVETVSMGKIGNVLYLAPVVETIAQFQSGLPLMQSNVIGDDTDVDPDDDQGTPLYNQTYEGRQSNVPGSASERSTYTKNTTKITTENTAAAAAAEHCNRVDDDVDRGAKNYTQATHPMDSVIGTTLTTTQIRKVEKEFDGLKRDASARHSDALKDEICHALLDHACFAKCENNFPRKLNAIVNAIKHQRWTTPYGMAKHKQQQELAEIKKLKENLYIAFSKRNYCDEMIARAPKYGFIDPVKLEQEKAHYESEISDLQHQLHHVTTTTTKEHHHVNFN